MTAGRCPVNPKATVLTVGHSTHSIGTLLALLRQYTVTAVADVRSRPYSRMNPQFNRQELEPALKTAGISYVFLGRELGARSEDESCYVDGRVSYERLAQTSLFRRGIERILLGSQEHVIALLCAEREPLVCHRAILVARELEKRGVEVRHIHADGTSETHSAAIDRLLNDVGIGEPDMFSTREERIAQAYRARWEAIAYVRPSGAATDDDRGDLT